MLTTNMRKMMMTSFKNPIAQMLYPSSFRSFSSAQIKFESFSQEDSKTPPKCFYPAFEEPEPEGKKLVDKIRGIPYSSYKLNDFCKEIRGKHLTEALTLAQNDVTKGARFTLELLSKMKNDGTNRGFNPDLFFVHEAWVGKGTRSKKIDIRARGKMGLIRRPKSSLTIVLREKPVKEMVRDALMGKAPPGIGAVFRQR
jgi:large subunit ribosomal protein L22